MTFEKYLKGKQHVDQGNLCAKNDAPFRKSQKYFLLSNFSHVSPDKVQVSLICSHWEWKLDKKRMKWIIS